MARATLVLGSKGIPAAYGGFETFLDKLTEYHQDNKEIEYHIACKKNGIGSVNETSVKGVTKISENEFIYHNAHCFKLYTPDIGSAQAILYDIKAIRYCCDYIAKKHLENPIVYVLSSRIGPVFGYYVRKIHRLGGKIICNPDGLEWKRTKYTKPARLYWKLSEYLMIKHADLVVCDSKKIQEIVKERYTKLKPKTTYIAYGAEVPERFLSDDDPKYTGWMSKNGLLAKNYYLVVGRFVPENNFETMLREFLKSDTKRDFVLITNVNEEFLSELESRLHFKKDPRVKFVGTVYDQELLAKIRHEAYAYLHGHEMGGTNPSLLEALASTDLNLLLDVGFNHEVAKDTALFWSKKEGDLANLIGKVDVIQYEYIKTLGNQAKQRMKKEYSWQKIADEYKQLWFESNLRGINQCTIQTRI